MTMCPIMHATDDNHQTCCSGVSKVRIVCRADGGHLGSVGQGAAARSHDAGRGGAAHGGGAQANGSGAAGTRHGHSGSGPQRSATPPSPDRAAHGAALTCYRPGIPSDSTSLSYVEGLPQCSTFPPLTPHESLASLESALRELLQLLWIIHEVQCSFCRAHAQVLPLLLQRQRWSPQHRSCQHLRRPRQCRAFLQRR